MSITVTWASLGHFLLIALGIILIALLCVAVKHLITTLKSVNKILEDTHKITEIAANRAKDIDGLVDKVSDSAINIADAVNGNQSIIKAFTVLINSIASLKNIIKKEGGKDEL